MTEHLDTEWTYDPRIDFSKTKKNAFVVNGRQTNIYQMVFSGATFNNVPTQTIVIPSNQALLRTAFFRMQGSLVINGTIPVGAPNANLLQPGGFGLRSNAMYRVMNTLSVNLGGALDNITLVSQMIDLLDRTRRFFWNDWTFWSGSSVLPDMCISYQDIYNTIKSPLNNYLSQGNGDLLQPRTSRISLTANTPTQATIYYDLVVPVLSSFLSGRLNDRLGLVRAGTFQVQVSFLTELGNMMSIDPAFSTITSITGAIDALTLNYQTIDVSDQNIPLQCYDAFQVTYWSEACPAVAAGATGRYTSIQRSWQVNPYTILCGVRPQRPTTTGAIVAQPDWWLALQTLSVNYIDTNSFVCNFDRQLYETSLENGIGVDYNQFAGGIQSTAGLLGISCPTIQYGARAGQTKFFLGGAPIALDPVRNLQTGKSYMDSHGMQSTSLQSGYTFTANLSYVNQGYDTVTPEFVMVIIQPMQFKEISPSQFIKTSYEINPANVTHIKSTITHLCEYEASMDLLGGFSFGKLLSSVGSVARKGAQFLRENPGFVAGLADEIAQQGIPGVSRVARHVSNAAERYGPHVQAALEQTKRFGYGGADEFEVARMRGEKIAGLDPMYAKQIYTEYMASQQKGGGMISRDEIRADIDRNSQSMRSKLRR